jgi:hypothetical protein
LLGVVADFDEVAGAKGDYLVAAKSRNRQGGPGSEQASNRHVVQAFLQAPTWA